MLHEQLEFSVASSATVGARNYQEDCCRIWRADSASSSQNGRGSLVVVLSDGMGGHVSGEIASSMACDSGVEHFAADLLEPSKRIESVLVHANQRLENAIRENPGLTGMGCTMVAVYFDDRGIQWASVGDSPLLVFRKNRLYRLNDDHSLGALLDKQAEANLISREEASGSPHRHSLRSALTGARIAQADVEASPQALLPGDWVIVASDGLNTLSGNEIAAVVAEHGQRTPVELTEKLIAAVEKKRFPNQDNATVAVIRVDVAEKDRTVRLSTSGGWRLPTSAENAEANEVLTRGAVIGQAAFGPPTEPLRRHRRGNRAKLVASLATLSVVLLFVAIVLGKYPGLLSDLISTPQSASQKSTAVGVEPRREDAAPSAVGKDWTPVLVVPPAPASRAESIDAPAAQGGSSVEPTESRSPTRPP